ncbi:MAG TPA: GAF domain-containing protein [Anaerolineaceae bacterium]|nr:GAF domain-containing protein [Anaerolineaceae bacterium]
MKPHRLSGESEWKQFLRLAEELMSLPDAASQCRLIAGTVAGLFACQSTLWLAKPVYPLPGQPPVPLIPGPGVPDLAQLALNESQILCQEDARVFQGSQLSASNPARSMAIPITSQKIILGVLVVERPEGTHFEKKDLTYLEALAAHTAQALRISQQATLKNWRSQQLALVRKVSAQIANIVELDELCTQITQLIQQTFHYYEVVIFTLEPGTDELCFRASARQAGTDGGPRGFKVKIGEGLIGQVAQTGREIVAPDVDFEPRYRYYDTLPETQSEATFPIKVEDRILGVLDIQSDKLDDFHEVDVMVLQVLADNIALAVEGIRLYSRLKSRTDQISAMVEVSHALTSILDLDQLMKEVVFEIQKRFGFQYVNLFTVHTGRRKVFYGAGTADSSQPSQQMEIVFDLDDPMGLIPWVARNNQTRLANDVSQDALYRPNVLLPQNPRSELAVPLAFGGDVLAVLDIQSEQLNAFDPDNKYLIEALASSISIAIRNATVYRSEQWRRQVGDSFRDVANLLSANSPLDKLLDTILVELERNLPCDASAIWLVDESPAQSAGTAEGLRLVAVHGVDVEELVRARDEIESARQWLEKTLQSSEPILRRSTDPYGPLGAALGFPQDYSSIAILLRIADHPLGVLTLAHHSPGKYGSDALLMTSTFAGYAAAAIQNNHLYAEAQEQAWVSTIMLQVAEACQSIGSAEELFETMVRLTRLLVGIKKSGIFLWNEAEQAFILKAWHGLDREPAQTVFRDFEVPAFARLQAEKTTIYIENAEAELNLPAAAISPDTGTLVMLPLMARDSLLGAFLVAHQPDVQRGPTLAFEQQVLSILQGIAHQMAVALENLRLLEARQEEAYVTAVLLQVAQAVVSQNDLEDILDTIVNLMPILVGIDACLIFLWDAERGVFTSVAAFTGSRQSANALRGLVYAPSEFVLLDCVRENGVPFFSLVAEADLPPEQWKNLDCHPIEQLGQYYGPVGDQWLLAFPLAARGEVLGVMMAREAGLLPILQERRLEIINGISQQTALAIQNELFKRQTLERERLEREFQLARSIQTNFLPGSLPRWPGWEIAARWETAREVGGDFYDIFNLGRDRVGLAIADVSDKGMPAALYMTVARTLIRAYARGARSPAAVLENVNRPLVNDSPTSLFVTAAFAILWPETGELLYASAGHNRPLIVRACSGEVEQLPLGGMAMGVYADVKLHDHRLELNATDIILFYTDGVTESFSLDGEIFGEERLKTLLAQNCGKPLQELLDTLESALGDWRGGAPPSDDTTILVLRRL